MLRWFDIDADPLLVGYELPEADLMAFHDALHEHFGTAGSELVRWVIAGCDVRGAFVEAKASLYKGEDTRLQRAASSFATLIVAGQVMEIETGVVKEVWDRWVILSTSASISRAASSR